VPLLELTTRIHAPIGRCFDLARCLELHADSLKYTGESIVAGVEGGLIELGQSVTFRARHFGVWQRLTSRLTVYDPPHHFRDSMIKGAFKRLNHDHFFREDGEETIMIDRFDFASPLGPLGWIADQLLLRRYMRHLLEERNRVIKKIAESNAWREYLA
jgi:ligand-binding SRPBCC domain-containing protein